MFCTFCFLWAYSFCWPDEKGHCFLVNYSVDSLFSDPRGIKTTESPSVITASPSYVKRLNYFILFFRITLCNDVLYVWKAGRQADTILITANRYTTGTLTGIQMVSFVSLTLLLKNIVFSSFCESCRPAKADQMMLSPALSMFCGT